MAGQMMVRARDRARNLRNRWIDQTLRQVELARRDLLAGECDVLLLAESSCLAFAHADQDRRLVPELLEQQAGLRVSPVVGAGFDARMFDSVLKALSGLEQRPRVVVLALNVRTNTSTAVTTHPIHGHPRTLAALERITPVRRRVRWVGRGGTRWTDDEIAAFRAQEITTRWGGRTTIDEHLAHLTGQGPPPWPRALERERFDYFHGEVVGPDHPALAALARLGTTLEAYGVPVVVYWAQPPVVRGEQLFPGEFAQQVHANLERVEAALDLEGHGFAPMVRPLLEEDDFQDARNGTEHYAFTGRVKIAAAIAEAVRRQLDESDASAASGR